MLCTRCVQGVEASTEEAITRRGKRSYPSYGFPARGLGITRHITFYLQCEQVNEADLCCKSSLAGQSVQHDYGPFRVSRGK